MKIILTGSTGMVGEGILWACLHSPKVSQVLSIGRKTCGIQHEKLQELLLPDMMEIEQHRSALQNFDACYFGAGISSLGLDETTYHHITYEITLKVAQTLLEINPNMVFHYISGASTDSTEKGKIMWARVKGKTENALFKMPFHQVICYRPGLMKPVTVQAQLKGYNRYLKYLFPIFNLFMKGCTTEQIGEAMIYATLHHTPNQIADPEHILDWSKKYHSEILKNPKK